MIYQGGLRGERKNSLHVHVAMFFALNEWYSLNGSSAAKYLRSSHDCTITKPTCFSGVYSWFGRESIRMSTS